MAFSEDFKNNRLKDFLILNEQRVYHMIVSNIGKLVMMKKQ